MHDRNGLNRRPTGSKREKICDVNGLMLCFPGLIVIYLCGWGNVKSRPFLCIDIDTKTRDAGEGAVEF